MLLRLRIALPDRPGSLGQVTRVLGVAGADITQIIVLERGDGRAVDDLTVFWPDSEPRERLVESLRGVEGVEVEGVWATREAPGTYPELEILKYITTAGDRALATLIDSMPVLFSADWAAAGTEREPHTVIHSSWRAPEQIPFPEIPARPTATTLDSGLHVIAAPLPRWPWSSSWPAPPAPPSTASRSTASPASWRSSSPSPPSSAAWPASSAKPPSTDPPRLTWLGTTRKTR
ncbi:ACT domain-containing protein [Thermocatellispora tengchongensis]|uniref:ACT domain-containing protein n=1 Tax=Thermocatellispora tengchongensis TaxID=1073253 RepID=UPI003629C921